MAESLCIRCGEQPATVPKDNPEYCLTCRLLNLSKERAEARRQLEEKRSRQNIERMKADNRDLPDLERVMNRGRLVRYTYGMANRKPYPTDVSDEEWALVAPYLILLPLDADQRKHDLREVFNALRWLVRTGAPWRYIPNDLPPWPAVYQQTQRWLAAGCFEAIVHDLRMLLRLAAGRTADPSAAIIDSRTLQSTPESGGRAGYDGYKRKKGSKVHVAVDTLGHLLALHVTPASEQDRAQIAELAQAIQEVTHERVAVAFVDQGYTGEEPANTAQEHGITLEVVKLPKTKRGFVLLPRRWVVERSFGWMARFRRLARDYGRLATMLAGLHNVAFVCLLLHQAEPLLAGGS